MDRTELLPLYEGNENYVFISYSHKDLPEIYPVIQWLIANHYRVWYDQGIHPGSDWPEVVASRLHECAVFMVFLSDNYMASQNCIRELHFAVSKRKRFLSILLGDVKMTPGVEMQLSVSQAIRKDIYSEELFYRAMLSSDVLPLCLEEGAEPAGENAVMVRPMPVPARPVSQGSDAEAEQDRQLAQEREEAIAKAVAGAQEKERQRAEKEAKRQAEKKARQARAETKRAAKAAAAEVSGGRKTNWLIRIGVAVAACVALILIGSVVMKKMNTIVIAGTEYDKGNTSLHLENTALTAKDLSAIGRMKELSILELTDCAVEGDLGTTLEGLPSLSWLSLTRVSGVNDLDFLNRIPALYTLTLREMDLKNGDLQFSAEMTRMTTLCVSGNPALSDISFLAQTPALTELDLCDNAITDAEVVCSLKKLRMLDLSGNRLTAITGEFASLNLNRLYLSGNKLTDLSGLWPLAALQRLEMDDCFGPDVWTEEPAISLVSVGGKRPWDDPLYDQLMELVEKSSATLERLSLQNAGLHHTDWGTVLEGCAALTYVDLSGNTLNDLHWLSGSGELATLIASGCGLTSVEGLGCEGTLRRLDLSDNALTDLTGLPAMKPDSYIPLDLRNNRLTTLADLPGGTAYTPVLLYGNPIALDGLGEVEIYRCGLDYSAGMEDGFDPGGVHTFYIANVPADKKVALEKNMEKTVYFGTIDLDENAVYDP